MQLQKSQLQEVPWSCLKASYNEVMMSFLRTMSQRYDASKRKEFEKRFLDTHHSDCTLTPILLTLYLTESFHEIT